MVWVDMSKSELEIAVRALVKIKENQKPKWVGTVIHNENVHEAGNQSAIALEALTQMGLYDKFKPTKKYKELYE